MDPFQIGTLIAFLTAFLAALWIFYDSNRQGYPATAYKTIATAMAVLALPGVILAISPNLLQDDPTSQVLTYLGLIAGGVAVMSLIFYTARVGLQVTGRQPCPGCGRPLDPTWDRCPYCGYSFVTVAAAPEVPTPAPSPPPEPAVPVTPKLQETRLLRPTPAHFAWLVVLNGPRKGQEFPLKEDVFIGRDGMRCEVVLDDLAVSDLHARIKREEEQFVLHDLGSTNGTFVNGERVYRHLLSDKDRLQLGETELMFIEVREEETQVTPPAEPAAGE